MDVLERTIKELDIALEETDVVIKGKQKDIASSKRMIAELEEGIRESRKERKAISDKIEILTAINLVFMDLRTGIEMIPGVKFATKILLDSAPAKLIQNAIMRIVDEIWDLTPAAILKMLGKGSYFYNMVHKKLEERGWTLQTVKR